MSDIQSQVTVEVIKHTVGCPHCTAAFAIVVLNNRVEGASVMFTSADPEGTDLMAAIKSGELFAMMQERIEAGGRNEVPEITQGA